MKENLRRPVLFAVIVITGSVLIFFDIPLIILIPVILIVGVLILFIVGAVTIGEIKTALGSVKQIGIIKKLDSMKFFEKSIAVQTDKKPPAKAETKPAAKVPEKKRGIGLHLNAFVSSVRSLGTLLKARSKSEKKVDEINKQLDKTVQEKVERSSASPGPGNTTGTSVPLPARGAGTKDPQMTNDTDPFLSLSEDEFDAGLLDSLDEPDSPQSTQGLTDRSPNPLPDMTQININEPDIPFPSMDIDGEAGDILNENAGGLEEFSGLDEGNAMDSDFGDLDSLSLDDVDLDDDTDKKNPQSPVKTSGTDPIKEVTPAEPGKEPVKTEWIKSDAPKNAGQSEDQISTHSDMAAFSGGASASDADMLSSLASDVKQVKKEKNISLLRELKDFKAPAAEIDSELNEVYTRMEVSRKTQKTEPSPPEGMK